jgi:hypothetical protein
MSNWVYKTEGTKTAVAATLAAATLADAVSFDPTPLNAEDATLQTQFSGAITAALALVGALLGPAQNVRCALSGTEDPATSNIAYNAGSKITVNVIEVW